MRNVICTNLRWQISILNQNTILIIGSINHIMAIMLVVPRQPLLVLKKHSLNNHFHAKKVIRIRNERTSSFSYKSISNLPLNELPGVYQSFYPYHILIFQSKPLFLTHFFFNYICRLPLINIWMTNSEYSKQYFLTKETLNNSMRYVHCRKLCVWLCLILGSCLLNEVVFYCL
jgi:hypothetical protein